MEINYSKCERKDNLGGVGLEFNYTSKNYDFLKSFLQFYEICVDKIENPKSIIFFKRSYLFSIRKVSHHHILLPAYT